MQVSKIYDFVKTNEAYFKLFLRFYACEPRAGPEYEFYEDATPAEIPMGAYEDATPAEVPMGAYDDATPADPMDIDLSSQEPGNENLPPVSNAKLGVCLPERPERPETRISPLR